MGPWPLFWNYTLLTLEAKCSISFIEVGPLTLVAKCSISFIEVGPQTKFIKQNAF